MQDAPLNQSTELQADGGRNGRIDGLRGIAIAMVVAAHTVCWLQLPSQNIFDRVVHRIAEWGVFGVQIFFVVSGFLIARGLIKTRSAPNYFSTFYIKRFFRIFPLYALYLLVCFHVLPLVVNIPSLDVFRQGEWSYWTFLCNFWLNSTSTPGSFFFDHLWSLSVEEQFYLLCPLFFYAVAPKFWVAVLIALSCVGEVSSFWQLSSSAHSGWLLNNNLLPLAAGATLAALIHCSKLSPRRATLVLLGAGATICIAEGGHLVCVGVLYPIMAVKVITYGITCIAAGCLCDSLVTTPTRLLRILTIPALQLLGRYCYCIYLVHFPIAYFVGKWLLLNKWNCVWLTELTCLALTLVLSTGLAHISAVYFERYFLDFGRRLIAKRSSARAALNAVGP